MHISMETPISAAAVPFTQGALAHRPLLLVRNSRKVALCVSLCGKYSVTLTHGGAMATTDGIRQINTR